MVFEDVLDLVRLMVIYVAVAQSEQSVFARGERQYVKHNEICVHLTNLWDTIGYRG